MTVAYDGTAFCGWQVQPNGVSIQSLVQNALKIVLRQPIDCTGSGRTDAGVHAQGQVAHFDVEQKIDPYRLRFALNALLPPDIRIFEIVSVEADFHARYSARSKIYYYHLHLDPVMDPFVRLYRHHIHGPCDVAKIREGASFFIGTHDFRSFANQPDQGSASRRSVKTLFRLDVIEQKGGIRLEFEADGFLYKMVRNITGALLEIGSGKLFASQIPAIFEAKDRTKAPGAAPAKGLFLMQVNYT